MAYAEACRSGRRYGAGPQSGEPSQFFERVTGLRPVPSTPTVKTSGRLEYFVLIDPLVVAKTMAEPSGENDPFWSRLTLRPKCVSCRKLEPSGLTV